MVLFGVVLIVIAASATIVNQLTKKASEQEKIATRIARGAGELSYLSNDYLMYRESQQLQRWQSRFIAFSSEVASLNVDRPEQQVLARNIKANEQRLKQVFASVASAVGSPSSNRSTALDLAFLQTSWSRMTVQCQGLVSDASRLSQLLRQNRDQLTATRTILIYTLVGLFGAFLLVSYRLTYRRILKSIVTLQAGTAVVGSGNLDFTIKEKKNDEIGDLSHAFNQMTANLKEITASKAELEREIIQRKQAQEDLSRQREWLRVTLSSIGDAVITSDTKGEITFLNPVAVTLTGWQLEETLGQSIQKVFRIINEKTHTPAEDLVKRVLTERRVVALANDTALVTKDGREVPIEDSAAPILDATGNVIGVVLVFHDVTEKRRAQARLREALERALWLARFPDQNPNPVIRASEDGTVLYCNPVTAGLSGWRCEVGKALQNELFPLVGRAMAEGKEVQQDVQLDGGVYIVWVAPFPGEGYANIYARDITARKQAEKALRGAQKRLETDLDAMTKLQKLGTLFLREGNLEPVLTEIVDAAIAISDADFGNIQLMDPASSNLKIAAQRGFPEWWLNFWDSVSKGRGACGTALERRERVIVEDIEQSRIFVGTPALEIQLKAGVRAVQCTPLVSRAGKPLGMFSTHYKMPHRPDDYALRLLDLLARQTADIIERAQAEEALRQRSLELQRLTETLEQSIQERTRELEVANEELKGEINKCQRVEVELKKSENNLRDLSIELLNAQEKERKMIAGEIHDSIGSSLSAIKFKVDAALTEAADKSPETTAALQSVIPIIQGAIDEARRIQMNLRPSMLDDLGLLVTVGWFCRQYETTYSEIRIDQRIKVEEHQVPDSLKTVIFRVLQEGLNNIAKHSRATKVLLSLRKKDRAIDLAIEDNGHGFDLSKIGSPGSTGHGFGLKSMQERTELSGGTFAIESTQGEGTTIRASWPF